MRASELRTKCLTVVAEVGDEGIIGSGLVPMLR
jgi:hypothetical protein